MVVEVLITITSDFGLKDSYVAQMKGAILSINPNAVLVDITHNVEKFNVRHAAFMLASAVSFFPRGTVHLAVVDPRVGTERRAIVVQTEAGCFVGPDNGLLMLAAKSQCIKHVYRISNKKFVLSPISNTFHGRDIFAPAAAYLDRGILPSEFGLEVTDPFIPDFVEVRNEEGSFYGEVLHVDSFGNIITNIALRDTQAIKMVRITLSNQTVDIPFRKVYGQANFKQEIALIGSHGFLEIALNQGNASEEFQVNIGDSIRVSPSS
jgi:S-adenosylmethionine hydrolase